MMRSLLFATSLLAASPYVAALNNGLARTPQMGWNDWNAFGCNVNQNLVLDSATRIQKYGLQAVGYHYIVIDDCWSQMSRSNGQLVADPNKFPSGMKYIGDQLHGQGFGFGMYSTAGTKTCGGYPASLGYETTDAKSFASWGVDYLKYDNCNNNGQSGTVAKSSSRYMAMENALNATGRSILYSLCSWGEDSVWTWGSGVGNSWRISGDITTRFSGTSSGCPLPNSGGYSCSVTSIMDKAASISSYGAPGGWNDLDMLEVGNSGLSDDASVTHFSIWAAVKSPLLIGTSMSSLSSSALSILIHAPIIAISQDPLGIPASRRWVQGNSQLWAGPVVSTTGGTYQDYVVVLVNTGGSSAQISATMSDIFGGSSPAATYEIRDLWASRLTSSQASTILSSGYSANPSLIYNSLTTPYASGLSAGNALLLGKSSGTVARGGSLSATVNANGSKVFRLRATGGGSSTGPTSASTSATATSTRTTTTSSSIPVTSCSALYGQCGGTGWTGPTCCASGSTCKVSNPYYSQCL